MPKTAKQKRIAPPAAKSESQILYEHCSRMVNRVIADIAPCALNDQELLEILVQATQVVAQRMGCSVRERFAEGAPNA